MDLEVNTPEHADRKMRMMYHGGSSDSVYGLGLIGAWVGWLIFTGLLGIGDDDVFDLGGILSAIIGVLIVLPIAGFALRRVGMSPERRPLDPPR